MRHLPEIATLVLMLSVSLLPGQKISGFVRDSSGVAVPYASVVATGCSDEQVLAYTTSNDLGAYQLNVNTDCDSITLTARSLGFSTTARKMATPGSPFILDFAMAATVFQEVVIRGKIPPVIARKDTTEFNVASFSDSTEFSVEDLLKKLPGVRVGEDGRISYNGKSVDRVMIEGDDLFHQNYQIATRNIRADLISKVQVIDRYEENPVLKDLRQTDRTVMNLQIKPDRKRSLSGSVTGGAGYGDEWKARGHTNLFSLSRKDKFYLIGTVNNTGQGVDAGVNLPYLTLLDPDKYAIQNNPLRLQGFISSASMEGVGLPSPYTRYNRSGVLHLSEVIPVSPYFKIKISASASRDRLRQETYSATRTFLGSSFLDITEQKAVTERQSSRSLQSEMDYFSPDKKHALRAFLKFNDRPADSEVQLLRSQTGGAVADVNSLTDDEIRETLVSVEYTLKSSTRTAFQLAGKLAWNEGRYLLLPQYAGYASFFGVDSSFIYLMQHARLSQNKQVLLGRLLSNSNGLQWTLETGVETYSGQMTSDIQLGNAQGTTQAVDDAAYRNDFNMQAPRYFANLSMARYFGRLRVQGRLNERYQPQYLAAPPHPVLTNRRWATEPGLNLRFEFNDKTSLTASYKLRQEAPELAALTPAFYFTQYASLKRGLPSLEWMSGHSAGFGFYFNNRPRQFSWNAGGGIQRNNNQFGGQYLINPVFSIQESFRPVEMTSYLLNTSASRYLKTISCRFEMGASIIGSQQTARINSDAGSTLHTMTQSLNISFGTAFDTWVNVLLDSRGSFSTLERGEMAAGNAVRSANLFSALQLKIRPSKKFDVKLLLHHSANQLERGQAFRHFLAANGVINWRIPAWHSIVELSAFNLLGSQEFEQVSADAFYRNSLVVQAVKTFFVLSWDYSF